MQIVIGLLCDGEGDLLSIEVFESNTQDTRTFGPQIRKVAQRFGGGVAQFNGFYVLKADLAAQMVSKEVVHGCYKDLALVEEAFRTSKTVELKNRRIHGRLATRTRGHDLVVMLACRIAWELSLRWASFGMRVQEGLDELAGFCVTEIMKKGRAHCRQIPRAARGVPEAPRGIQYSLARSARLQRRHLQGKNCPKGAPRTGMKRFIPLRKAFEEREHP